MALTFVNKNYGNLIFDILTQKRMPFYLLTTFEAFKKIIPNNKSVHARYKIILCSL